MVTKELTKRILDGTMVPTGFRLQQEEIPADLLEVPPAPPSMNICVRGGPDQKQLQIPESWFKRFADDSATSRLAHEFLDKFNAEFGVAILSTTPKEDDIGGGLSPLNRARVQKQKPRGAYL